VKYTVNFISSVLRREDAHSDSLYCLLRVLPWHLSCNWEKKTRKNLSQGSHIETYNKNT